MSYRIRRVAWSVAAAVFASSPVLAQTLTGVEPDSEWEAFVPPVSDAGSTPASPLGPTTPEGGFSAPERVIFGEKMRERVLDQLCRNIKLNVNYNFPGDLSGTGGDLKRWLVPLPDGLLTIVDEERLSVGYGHGFSKVPNEAAGAAIGLWVGGRIEGASMVIRPLKEKATCKELDTLLDLRDIKTVLPFKAARVSAMKVGELWRLPFRLTVGHAESIGGAVQKDLNISVSFGGTESGAATLTLYRLSESQLRFRFRVDRVEVRTFSGGLVESIPAVEFAAFGANILAQFVDRELAGQLSQYTTAELGFSVSRAKGKRVVLEYIVDPRDPVQAEAVVEAIRGDFQSLVKMGWLLGTQQATDKSTEEAYLRLKTEHDARLGPAAFAAINAYIQKTTPITLKLPFLTSQKWTSLKSDDTMTRYTEVQGHIHFDRAGKSRQSEYVTIPWVGPLFKDSVQRDVQVVTAARTGDEYGDPIVVYLQQHGFLRATESSVRENVKTLSDIMVLAGTRGEGPNQRLALPFARHLPEPPAPKPRYGRNRGSGAKPESTDLKGEIAFTLVFNQKAVKQLMAATAEDIVKAYAAVAESQPGMRWLMANSQFTSDGRIDYDRNAARRQFPDDERGRNYEYNKLSTLAREAAGLIFDLLAARNAPNNESRSEALMQAFGGLGRSGLSYDRALRVFVQLVDPMNLSGDFVASVECPTKEKNLALHYVLKKGRPDSELLRLSGEAKARFAEPSILVD